VSNCLVFLATSNHSDIRGWVCGHTSVWQCCHQLSRVFILTIIGWYSNISSNAKREAGRRNTVEALKWWNLECINDADQHGKDAPSELKLEDLLS
jgi:hypothetical protein